MIRLSAAPSPNGTNRERLFLLRATERGHQLAQDGKLADAIRKKYRTPKAALKALGIDVKLLDPSRLAYDAKARDSVLGGDDHAEYRALCEILANELEGERHETAQRLLDRIIGKAEESDGMVDDEEREDDLDDAEEDPREERRAFLRKAADMLSRHGGTAFGRGDAGLSEDEIRNVLSHMPMPKNAISAGRLGAGLLAEDLDDLMQERAQRKAGMAKDRLRRRQLARDSFAAMFPDAARLDGAPIEAGIGGTEEERRLAMDAAGAQDDGSFDKFFPNAARMRNG
jgi:hypothetical protein